MEPPDVRLATILAVIALSIPALHHAQAHVRITTNVTWAKDIRPILLRKCMPCHSPGGIAPDYVDLTTYGYKPGQSGARDWAKAIEEEVSTRRMPPWKPDERFGSFKNQRRLTQQEIELILAWTRGGAPQGTPRDLPAPPVFTTRDWSLGKPDLIVVMPNEHVIPAGKKTDYVSVRVPIELEQDEWLTGYEFKPGSPDAVHTIMAFIHDPKGMEPKTIKVEVQKEYEPRADKDAPEKTRERALPPGPHFLGQWARGDEAVLFPDAAGRKVRKGSTIELQITYFKQGDDGHELRDQSKLGLYFAREEVDLLVESGKIANEDFLIKAGRANQEVRASLKLNENAHLIAIHPQAGLFAKDLEIRGIYPDGKPLTLLWIPDYEHKWESSYVFEKPIPAPAGTEIQLIGHYDNSANSRNNQNGSPKNVKSGPAHHQERLVAWVDYTLDDHLIVTTPGVSPAPISQTQATGDPARDLSGAAPASSEPYWCPMRGLKGCGIKDYPAAGRCDVCGMTLEPKSKIVGAYKEGIAATKKDWSLTEVGRQEVYFCPNRGRPDHALTEYSAAGRCDVCGDTLIHKARFEEVRTWTCLTDSCAYFNKVFYSPARCPGCGEPVESMGHMDHNPVHGGILFMAENKYHHIEGTHPAPDEFRMYFYDDYKRALDPRNFAGRMVIEQWDDKKEAFFEKEFPLALETEGNTWLTSRIPVPTKYPIELIPRVWLAGEEKLFNFFFGSLTREPGAQEISKARLHKHGERPPIGIPEAALDVVREIFKRARVIQERIEAKDWFGLHVPAFDTIELAAALKHKMEGLSARQRRKLGEGIVKLGLASDGLDRAGDSADEGRVLRYHESFREALAALKEIFPKA